MVPSPPIVALPWAQHPKLDLWLIDLDADSAWWHAPWLSPREQERAGRFRFEVHARRYRASHLALRFILGQAVGRPPASLLFTEGIHGKPRLLNAPSSLHFNMSHSAGWALVGVCPSHPVGVDIEVITAMDDAALLAEKNFSAAEFAVFQATPAPRRLEAFFRCWTRKEACLKALGSGLSIDPHKFEAGLDTSRQDTFIAVEGQACAMSVNCIDLPIPALAAIATLRDADSPLVM